MTLALSTSWISDSLTDPERVIDAVKKLGVRAVELDYRITPTAFYALRSALKQHRIDIVSLHNFCPWPQVVPNARPSGDYFSLSSTDGDIRKHAVEWTTKTIEHANDCEAGCVVLHCGSLPAPPNSAQLYAKILKDGRVDGAQRRSVQQALQQLQPMKTACLDALMFSLDRLISVAERNHVVIGLESRFHFFELPGFEEMKRLLTEFDGAPIGYWHDTGHVHAQEVLGIVEKGSWLEDCGGKLAGIHLHDAHMLNDHLALGKGEIDFSTIKPFFEQPQPIVLELAPGTTDVDLQMAVDVAHMFEGKKGKRNTDFSLDLTKNFY